MRCAGIVTYNPDLERLRANLNNTASQVDAVFVFDNGSENVADIRSLADSEYTTLRVEADPNNRGIAFALNRLLDAAKEHGSSICCCSIKTAYPRKACATSWNGTSPVPWRWYAHSYSTATA